VTQIVWLLAALEDLRGIHGYIARDNPAAARRVIGAVRDQVKVLQAHPSMGRPGRIEGTRELVIGRYPYIVAYRQTASTLEILAVVHTSRLWPDTLP
jgi:addiction module RelE/StbE family toxin